MKFLPLPAMPFRSAASSRIAAALIFAALILLSGCAAAPGTPLAPATAASLSGRFAGGQQPIGGAAIALYAAGSSGNRGGAVSLLTVPVFTGPDGSFTITGDYTCPSSATQVYLVGRGGNPGLASGTTNPASVLMAALGDCGDLSSTTFINVNEVTTVASAWALAQFLGPNASIGASASNATGLRNAFLIANSLANLATGYAGGALLSPGTTLESAKIYSLANVLASCVNSDGGASCLPLFSAATVAGTAPSNTLDAALNIVRNPAQNVAAVFNACSPQGPFQPALGQVPHDWTLSLTYSGGGLNSPTALALDSTGSVWVANYFGHAATKLSPTGVAGGAAGFPDPGLNESYGITVDAQDNAWITNEETAHSTNNGLGSLSKFSPTGQLLSGSGLSAGGIYFPYAVAADSNGSIWVADYGRSAASLLASDGTSLAGSGGYSSAGLPLPVAVAVDGSHNAWFAGQGSASRVTPAGVITQFACCRTPSAIAVDPSGSVWVTDYSASALVQLGADGRLLQKLSAAGGLFYPQSVAIDGAGAAWVANYRGNTVSAFTGGAPGSLSSALSPAGGFGLDAALGAPFGLALDASGGVWIANFSKNSVTQLVGLAAPIRTPLLGPPAQP